MFLTFKTDNLEQQKQDVINQIKENKRKIEELIKIEEKTYMNFVRPYQMLNERLNWVFKPIAHLNYVKNSEETQKVYTELLPIITEYYTSLGQNEKIYRAFKDIYEKEKDTLTDAQKRVLELTILDFELSGVSLPENEKGRIKEINLKLSDLQNQFAQNLLNATNQYELIIENFEDVKELPETELKAAETEKDGKKVYRFTLHAPSYLSYMTYGNNRSLREELYKAYTTRAPENEDLLEEILNLRDEEAKLLGFKNYAELSLKKKMAPSPDKVLEFLYSLAEKTKPQGIREFEELQNFANKIGFEGKLEAFDVPYYSEKLKKEKFNLDEEEYKPYFEKNSVVNGLLKFLNKLFKVDFEKVDVPVWDDSVLVYDLKRDNETFARIYMDLESRPDKRGGAWMDDWQTGCLDEKNCKINPVAFIVANFPPATEKQPSLLRHYDVVTLFHEMGHAIHHLFSEVTESFVSGTSGVEWDAVEFPSQFLENFAYEKSVLKTFARHYETGEVLPDEMIDKLIKAKNFQSALAMLRQLEFAIFDMLVHIGKHSKEEVQEILDNVREEVAVIKPPRYNKFQNSFAHIFAGGYAAGYYSYKWAEVLSADAFFIFIDNDIFDEEVASKFLKAVLSQGGSKKAMDIFKEFTGREPDIDALLKLSGIEVVV
jgi:oligopeptidase A